MTASGWRVLSLGDCPVLGADADAGGRLRPATPPALHPSEGSPWGRSPDFAHNRMGGAAAVRVAEQGAPAAASRAA